MSKGRLGAAQGQGQGPQAWMPPSQSRCESKSNWLDIELPWGPAVPHLETDPGEVNTYVHTHACVLSAR